MDPDPDPDPAIFVIDFQDANKKLIFLKKIFCLLLLEDTFTSFFKNKKSKRNHKIVGITGFLTIFA
jgi:predicted lactoylglutathione lyase